MTYRLPLALPALLALAACAAPNRQVSRAAQEPPPPPAVIPQVVAMYSARPDGDKTIPAVPTKYLSDNLKREEVTYYTAQPAGTVIVDPGDFHLYYVLGHDRAIRYSVSVGKQGYGFSGEATIPYKREWPRWTPTPSMLKRDPATYDPWRNGMPGGLENPLGARALYLFRGGKDTLYRIHGTPYPWTIGKATTDGCIRLFDQDITDLYGRIRSGAKVIVRPPQDTGKGTFPPGTPVPPEVMAARIKAIAQANGTPVPASPATASPTTGTQPTGTQTTGTQTTGTAQAAQG